MKSSYTKIYLGISSTIAINILYFVWQPYEKCVIDYPLRETWLPDLFTNILYYLIYFGWLIMLFFATVNNKITVSPAKIVARMLGMLFLLQLPLELIKLVAKICISQFEFIIQDICAAVGFIVGLLLLCKIGKIYINMKSKLFFGLILVIFLVIFGVQAARNVYYTDVGYAYDKYVSGSMFIYVAEQNYKFICEICSLLCEIIVCSIIFIFFLFATQKSQSKTDNKSINKVKVQSATVITKIIAYTILLVIAFFIITCFKTVILPHSSFAPFSGISSPLPEHSGEPSTELDKGFANKSINRYVSRKNVKSVYSMSEISLGSNNVLLYSFKINYSMLENLPNELDNLVEYECVLDNNQIRFFAFGNELLIIQTQHGYRFIKLENINSLQEDAVVTECIKYMINEGVFSYFEYGCDYLKKYDYDFIKPYIKRYANGNFSTTETRNVYNTDINGKYIQNLAKKSKR